MTPGYLEGTAVFVSGDGGAAHRAVVVALAQAGANVAVGGAAADLPAEAALHSIANEIWALGRRSVVVPIKDGDAGEVAAMAQASEELGRIDLILRCDPALQA